MIEWKFFGIRRKEWRDLRYIFSRNIFLLTNGIIAAVVCLLVLFGDMQSGVFLGFILVLNMTLGLAQDIRAWYTLRALQLLTAPRAVRIHPDDGHEEMILTEAIRKGDTLKIVTGDEIPCDGVLLDTKALELSLGLITGESASIPQKTGDRILAGSIVTAGSGRFQTETISAKSRIARMTEGIRRYQVKESPIQHVVNQVIRFAGYVLVAVIGIAVSRAFLTQTQHIIVIKNIGALASILVPQGLAFAMTLLFAYGAVHLHRRNVLLQEVNATEKLGRIRNLCMDKTGTLTENTPTVERMEVAPGWTDEEAKRMTAAYICGANDASQTMRALGDYVKDADTFFGEAVAVTPFSSWHPYGGVEMRSLSGTTEVLVIGSGSYLLPFVTDTEERAWFDAIIGREAAQGKRIICLAKAKEDHLPKEASSLHLSLVALFVLSSQLRPGIPEAIAFFQNRGVRIRIISGDHPETVRTVAKRAGVAACELLITGKDMHAWTEDDFIRHVHEYTLFARVEPEQKEKIISALKQDGFTAMVGDGANDALAMKKADLGIAMFEGAPATRELASVVLMNNSFTALPGGVELADSIILNAEVFASLFFSTALMGLFLFCGVSLLGYPFPLTPLNITLINYIAIGFPGIIVSYWTIRPAEKATVRTASLFLSSIAPFIVWSALLQAVALLVVFSSSPEALKVSASNIWIVLSAMFIGHVFFLFAPGVYRGALRMRERRDLLLLTVVEVLLLLMLFQVPFLLRFFEISGGMPNADRLPLMGIFFGIYGVAQWGIARSIRKFPSDRSFDGNALKEV